MAFLVTFAVGTLRKYASGIFLVSDLGGYAAVASAVFTQRDRAKVPRARKREILLSKKYKKEPRSAPERGSSGWDIGKLPGIMVHHLPLPCP